LRIPDAKAAIEVRSWPRSNSFPVIAAIADQELLRRVEVWIYPRDISAPASGTLGHNSSFSSVHVTSEGLVNAREQSSPRSITLRVAQTLRCDESERGLPNSPNMLELRNNETGWQLALSVFSMVREDDQGLYRTVLYVFELLRNVASHAELNLLRCSPSAAALARWQIVRVEETFAAGVSADLSIATLAGRCGLSVCQFARAFKATYGATVHKYVIAKRIERAQELLASSCLSNAEIALECGFADQAALCRRFLASVGISPPSWRRAETAKRRTQSEPIGSGWGQTFRRPAAERLAS
jgi:AraC-like DNA-binding protein